MSTRPRPRPKPRPRVASHPPPSSPDASSATSPPAPVTINIDDDDDDDARFFKNRNMTLQSWKKLDKLAEEQDVKRSIADSSPSPEEDSEIPPTPRRRKHKKTDSEDLPSWTKDPKAALVSSDESSDDDIVEIVGTSSSTSTRLKIVGPKRKRSRSRSLTPPPALPAETLQYARETVRRMLGGNARAASPTFIEDDSFDEVNLDPELAKIAMEAKRQSSLHPTHSRSASPEAGGGPPIVKLKVRWKRHPLNPGGKDGVWAFQMKRHDSFSILFNEIADIAGVLTDNVIITCQGKRVFSTASPHGIDIWENAELDAYDKQTFEYLQNHRHQSPGPTAAFNESRGSSPAVTEGESAASEAEGGADDDDKLRITLRAASLKSYNITVRQTTKCSAILAAFLKHHKLTDKYPSSPTKGKKGKVKAPGPALVVDGDRLNPDDEISVADLDDGDMVDVVGL